MTLDIIYTITSDNLRLPGVHFISHNQPDTCLLVVHGMSGNILENYWADILGRTIANAGIGCIYSHNRGYGMISDPTYVDPDSFQSVLKNLRSGVVYERYLESIFDITAWVKTANDLGYLKVILLGHSLGASKVIKYFHTTFHPSIVGIVLASAADMIGNGKSDPNYNLLLKEATKNIKLGKPSELLSHKLWDWCQLSSQTFLDLFIEGGEADNLPILKNPNIFPEIASINVPILNLIGEKDDIVMHSLTEDLAILKSKAISCPSFSNIIIDGANHNYETKEKEFSNVVLSWLKSL